ncbi:MAG TPA: hypothetical protein VMS08_03325 [Candidatus Saccharimonadia bacterium]|nr:hypothetical protein [Candidatus Saccharimonadia bacterium]
MSVIIGVIVFVAAVAGYMVLHMPKAAANTTASQTNLPTVNNAVLVTKASSSLGQYLTDPSGKALYTYGSDTSGVSNCTGTCIASWPPYLDSGSATNLPAGVGTITRMDSGKLQYTFNGMPLYFFVADVLGHVTGNGVSGFHIAKPATPIKASASTIPSPSQSPQATSASSQSSTNANW